MRPASFDPVISARQIVYSYTRRRSDEAYVGAAGPIGARCVARPAPVPQLITLIQVAVLAAIAVNLWRIAAQ
jgi:hypothetical protein